MSTIYFDSNNPALIRSLMEEYGDSKFPFFGENDNGESIEIHICPTSVIHVTYQNNGWIRKDCFDEHGYYEAEMYGGRWR